MRVRTLGSHHFFSGSSTAISGVIFRNAAKGLIRPFRFFLYMSSFDHWKTSGAPITKSDSQGTT